MTAEEKSNLLNLIRAGNVQAALDQLHSITINESNKNEVIAIAARFKKLKQEKRLGILSFEQANLTENQITTHLIDLINNIYKHPFSNKKTTPSSAAIDSQKEKKSLAYKIGIAGSIASILGLLLYFLPLGAGQVHQLTVFVTDIDGNVVLEHKGVLNTSIGNRPLRETIGEHGRTNFGDILSTYLGDTITIGFKAEGWEVIGGKNTFVFSGEPIQLKVKKDNRLGLIKGVVKTRDGQGFISAALIRINNDTTILTNELGIFKMVLPESMRVTNLSQQYELTISKEGYTTVTKYYPPKSNAEIRLEKK